MKWSTPPGSDPRPGFHFHVLAFIGSAAVYLSVSGEFNTPMGYATALWCSLCAIWQATRPVTRNG